MVWRGRSQWFCIQCVLCAECKRVVKAKAEIEWDLNLATPVDSPSEQLGCAFLGVACSQLLKYEWTGEENWGKHRSWTNEF